ncbi:hypothetical protein FSP39_016251 [Pinctada imbricata]|uniref:Uncharacterized protein n=1 Tax=Pinctada imbricata TaxID=66713 RepID=A0AA88Y0G5_PINIB|nr:hypothetical protein FSP39_016251 [Pinctada imbricata]
MSSFVVADYCVFGVTIIISLGIGIYYALSGGRQKTTSEYLVGNRQMKILPVALSLMVSFESSIMMLGFPAETYVYGMMFWLSNFAFLVSVLLAVRMVVPLVHPLKLTSVYENLSLDVIRDKEMQPECPGFACTTTRLAESWKKANPGHEVTDFPMWASIYVVTAASVVYTSIGTMVAGGVSNVFEINKKSGRLDIFEVLIVSGPAFFLTLSLALLEGLVAFAYFSTTRCDPLASDQITNPNQITSSVLSAFNGPMTGVFLLGIFCPWIEAKGAFVGGVTGVFFTFWLSMGSNFSRSLRKTPWLPLAPTDQCFPVVNDSLLMTTMNLSQLYVSPLSSYQTSTMMEDVIRNEPQGLDKFYALSYQWFSVVGVLVTVVVGTVISLIVAKYKPEEADVRFMLPFFDQFFPFLPKRLRRYLYFGVDFERVRFKIILIALISGYIWIERMTNMDNDHIPV